MYEENNNNNNYNPNWTTNTSQNSAPNYNNVNQNQQKTQEYYYYAGNTHQNTQSAVPPKAKKGNGNGIGFAKRAVICLSLGLVFGLAAGSAFAVPTYLANKASANLNVSHSQPQNSQTTPALDTTANSLANAATTASTVPASTVENIAKSCLPSVVSITNKGVSDVRTMFGNFQQEYQSSGSGIIIGKNDTELLIVTNNHVVSGSKDLSVVFSYDESSDNPTVVEAKLKGYDSDKDLAVIAVSLKDLSDDTLSQIKIATVGDSSKLQLGQEVVAIGNALGYGQSVTTGIISALNRDVSVSTNEGDTITNKLIQTDAAINPGNSGGALLNMNGELVGINSVKVASSEVEGMGYAIPISDVQDIINELMIKETRDPVDEADQGYIGIAGTDVSSEISNTYNLPVGIYVNTVYEKSPAAQAGIQKGYIITKFDGSTVKSMSELKELLSYYKAGETVTVLCQVQSANGYEEKSFSLTLGTKEAIEAADSSKESSQTEETPSSDGAPSEEEAPSTETAPSQGENGKGFGNFPFFTPW